MEATSRRHKGGCQNLPLFLFLCHFFSFIPSIFSSPFPTLAQVFYLPWTPTEPSGGLAASNLLPPDPNLSSQWNGSRIYHDSRIISLKVQWKQWMWKHFVTHYTQSTSHLHTNLLTGQEIGISSILTGENTGIKSTAFAKRNGQMERAFLG